jgi:hypothetical protein
VKNAPRVHFGIHENQMVREVPNFPAAPPAPQNANSAAITQAGILAYIKPPKAVRAQAKEVQPREVPPKEVPPKESSPKVAATKVTATNAAIHAAPVNPVSRKPPAGVKRAIPARAIARRRSG